MRTRRPETINLPLPSEQLHTKPRRRCWALEMGISFVQGCIAGVILTPPAWAVWQFFQP